MKNRELDVSGLTVAEAMDAMEKFFGQRPPRIVEEAISKVNQKDGKIIDLKVQLETGDKSDLVKAARDGSLLGVGAEGFVTAPDMARDHEPWLEEAQRRFGPEPEYNGVLGDSCVCPACNYRRKLEGVDLTKDLRTGVTFDESMDTLKAGYAAVGKPVPKKAVDYATLNTAMNDSAVAKAEELFPSALKGIQELFGKDHPNVQKLKDLMDFHRDPDKVSLEARAQLLGSLQTSVDEAIKSKFMH